MANIMSLKSLRNKTSRNGFDLSTKRNLTAKPGELLPYGHWAVLPGDTFKIGLKSFTRTQPLNTAAFARMREYYDFFFVPYDLLWNKSRSVLTQMNDNVQHAVSLDPTQNGILSGEFPFVTTKGIADYINSLTIAVHGENYFGYRRENLSCKLLEYLGYGNFENFITQSWVDSDSTTKTKFNLQYNIFPLLAYQKIYADYFRDSQWERVSPSTFNVDYMTGVGTQAVDLTSNNFLENYNFFDLRYCNWQKDLFHGVLPRQQYGNTAMVGFSGDVDAYYMTQTPNSSPESNQPFSSTNVNIKFDKDNAAGFSILALRQAEFLQKWKEITMSANKDYKDQIQKHWGVSVGDAYSDLCTYLGGISSSLDINEVVNNNITESYAADIAGKGVGVSNGNITFTNPTNQYGIIMCIYHCLPLIDYTTDLVDPMVTKVNAVDFAIPEFDRVGMQPVPTAIFSNPVGILDEYDVPAVLGYAPRYIEYKTGIDYSAGGFKRSLKNWVISFDNLSFASQLGQKDLINVPNPAPENSPYVNYTMFKVNPNSVDPLFAVKASSSIDTDQFLCSTFFDIKAVRNLDTDGLPY